MGSEKQRPMSRQQKERFRKRRVALFKKATTMLDDGTKIYIILRRRNKHYTFTSNRNSSWPPLPEDVVNGFTSLFRLVADIKQPQGSTQATFPSDIEPAEDIHPHLPPSPPETNSVPTHSSRSHGEISTGMQEKQLYDSDPRHRQDSRSDTSDTNNPTVPYLTMPSPRLYRTGTTNPRKPPISVWMPPILQRSPLLGSFYQVKARAWSSNV